MEFIFMGTLEYHILTNPRIKEVLVAYMAWCQQDNMKSVAQRAIERYELARRLLANPDQIQANLDELINKAPNGGFRKRFARTVKDDDQFRKELVDYKVVSSVVITHHPHYKCFQRDLLQILGISIVIPEGRCGYYDEPLYID